MTRSILARSILVLGFTGAAASLLNAEPVERIKDAEAVLREIMATPDKAIPDELLEKAYCVGIIPYMKKGGFILAAQYGVGVVLCRGKNHTGWTGPSVERLEGGSVGLQLGAGETDLVFLVMNQRGAEKLMKTKFVVGGEASAMAGPVGRDVTASTDALMHAEILSWSRSRGIFAGISLKGNTLRPDDDENTRLYGHPVKHEAVLNGKVKSPPQAAGLIRLLDHYSFREESRNMDRRVVSTGDPK
jgi:SH3 domain-containing YSC84-like protein 1